MAHFAKLDSNNKVVHISVVDNENLLDEHGNELEELGIQYLTQVHEYSNWKQTSYNNKFRGSYAAIGDTYYPEYDAFLQDQPFPSWSINPETKKWEAPVPKPEGLYRWNEGSQEWVEDEFEKAVMEEIANPSPNGFMPSPQQLVDELLEQIDSQE
jgi:hypothetical protein